MGKTVAVQERQRFAREGLVMVLGAEPDLEVVGAVAGPRELAALCADARPDVVVLELDAEEWDACRLAAALRKHRRSLVVIGTAVGGGVHLPARARRAGVRAVVGRDGGVASLLRAVRLDAEAPGAVAALPPPAPPTPRSRLTARQLEVLRLVGAGCTTREIAARLGISAKTVENHKQRIFARLGVHNQAHAVARAMRAGLVEPGVAFAAGAGR